MRRYETIFILDPDLAEEGRSPVLDRVKDLIPKEGGTLLKMDEWGTRKLAYLIKKKPRGYYVRADYCGGGAVVDEMERFFKIDDRVLKYMTILLEEAADVDQLLADLAKDAEVKEAASASEPEPESTPTRSQVAAAEQPETENTEEAASNDPRTR